MLLSDSKHVKTMEDALKLKYVQGSEHFTSWPLTLKSCVYKIWKARMPDDTYTILYLSVPFFPLRLVPIYFNTEIISTLLPVHFAVGDGEEVLDTQRLPGRQFNDGDTRGDVLMLRRPVRDNVVGRGPSEISQVLYLHTLLVQQPERL